MLRKLILVTLLGLMTFVRADGSSNNLAALQSLLNSAFADDAPIVLSGGTDFMGPAGTVIFLSREKGAERMVALARAGEDELAMLFLPKFQAWITETTSRTYDKAEFDSRYANAAIASKIDVELWHTHNDVGRKLLSGRAYEQRSLGWTMPSKEDLMSLYSFDRLAENTKVTAAIANVYGVTRYRLDQSLWEMEPRRISSTLLGEAYGLNYKVGEISSPQLQEFARNYQGQVRLDFEPMSRNIRPNGAR